MNQPTKLRSPPASLPPGGRRALPAPATAQDAGRFVDVTAASGVAFTHETGAFGQKWLPETMGAGVVVFDYNGDDRQDLLFLNGRPFPGRAGKATTQALYRNRGGLRFSDATREAGLDVSAYCLAGAAADLDNDGDADLYLSCLGTDILLRNDSGRFTDVSKTAGLSRDYEFGASVALFDADGDGWLDILATRYVTWTPETDIRCSLDGVAKSYCTPESYPGASPRFYRNRGDFTFEDRTRAAGVYQPNAKSLGIGGAGPRRRRLARRGGGQRHPAEPAAAQPGRRHLRGDRRAVGHGLLRDRHRPRRHGHRRRRLRPQRPPEPGDRQLRQRDDGAVPQRGQLPLRRRGATGADRPAHPAVADLRRLLLRLRSRRLARHVVRQRPPRPRDRERPAQRRATPSRRSCSATPAAAASRRSPPPPAATWRSRAWRAAPPTPISTATATRTWC